MSTLEASRVSPARPPATLLVVLCHGYGSDGNDLIGLAPHWRSALPGAAFVAPNAPERVAGAGYQWFPLSRIDPQETLRGTEGAAPTLTAFIDEELARLQLTGDRLALVGFSQGTMMSLYVGLRRNPRARRDRRVFRNAGGGRNTPPISRRRRRCCWPWRCGLR